MKAATPSPFRFAHRRWLPALAVALMLAGVAGFALVAAAQDEISPTAFENEFAAQRAEEGNAAPADPASPASPSDELITNLTPQGMPVDAAAPPTTPAITPDAQAPVTVADDVTIEAPVVAAPDAAMPETAPDAAAMPADTITPDATAGGPQPATAPPDAPDGAQAPATDPLASFRAQAAIAEAERTRAAGGEAAANPLGPAATLPVGNAMQSPEDMQLELEAEAAAQAEKVKQQIYDASVESLLPLTPEQTRSVLDTFRESREAAETPIAVPTARTTVENVSLDPSQPPLSIKTSPGYVTTLTILDMTGAPWAIQDISWAGKFEITTPEEGGHVIRITPMSAHGVGNISIRLVDLITPVTFSIDTGLDVVDYRFDARIPKPGPLAKTPLIENGGLRAVAGTDENLMRVLDGTSVAAAQRLMMDGVDGATSAYRIDDMIYLRTPLTLLSPSWQTSATSADGMNVYTLRQTPVILLSDRGRMVKARVKAEE